MKRNRRGEHERGFSMMLGRIFDPRDTGLLLTVVYGPDGQPAAMCQFVPSAAIRGYSLDLMRRDPGEHPNGLLDFALCSTIDHLRAQGQRGLSLNFAAMRSTLEGETGDGLTQRVERWALERMSGVLQIESLWKFNAKYEPRLAPPLRRLRLGRAVRPGGGQPSCGPRPSPRSRSSGASWSRRASAARGHGGHRPREVAPPAGTPPAAGETPLAG